MPLQWTGARVLDCHLDHDLQEARLAKGVYVEPTRGDHVAFLAVDSCESAFNARLTAHIAPSMANVICSWIVAYFETCTKVASLGVVAN